MPSQKTISRKAAKLAKKTEREEGDRRSLLYNRVVEIPNHRHGELQENAMQKFIHKYRDRFAGSCRALTAWYFGLAAAAELWGVGSPVACHGGARDGAVSVAKQDSIQGLPGTCEARE